MADNNPLKGQYHPYGISQRVPSMKYAADVNIGHPYALDFGAPVATDTDGILAAFVTTSATAHTINTFTSGVGTATAIGFNGLVPFDSLTVGGNGWGRTLVAVGGAATTRIVTVTGYDYLGSKMVEAITMNGTTPVLGVKAFASRTALAFLTPWKLVSLRRRTVRSLLTLRQSLRRWLMLPLRQLQLLMCAARSCSRLSFLTVRIRSVCTTHSVVAIFMATRSTLAKTTDLS
jgi:hypothetical protein